MRADREAEALEERRQRQKFRKKIKRKGRPAAFRLNMEIQTGGCRLFYYKGSAQNALYDK